MGREIELRTPRLLLRAFRATDGQLLWTAKSQQENTGAKYFGYSVAGLGDLNGDGRGDFAVGSQDERITGGVGSGRVYVYSGATGELR